MDTEKLYVRVSNHLITITPLISVQLPWLINLFTTIGDVYSIEVNFSGMPYLHTLKFFHAIFFQDFFNEA